MSYNRIDVSYKEVDGVKKFDNEYLISNCSQWLDICIGEMKLRIESVLKYVGSLKNLVMIKEAVIQFESGVFQKSNAKVSSLDWAYVCESLFKRKIELWSQLVSQFYNSHSKVTAI